MSIIFSRNQEMKLRRLLSRALNKNQIIILKSLEENKNKSINSLVSKISKKDNIPHSTIKLNIRILKELSLITIIQNQESKRPKLTKFGKTILRLMSYYTDSLQRTFIHLVENIFKPYL